MLDPDPDRALQLNGTLENRLFVAFDHIVGDVLFAPKPPQWPCDPCAFALQDLFRQAAVSGDIAALQDLYRDYQAVLSGSRPADGLHILPWGSDVLTGPEWALLQAAFQDDIGLTADLVAADTASVLALQHKIPSLLAQLGAVLPNWEREFQALVRWIVLAGSTEGRFAGASAFAAWGAILVNPKAQGDALSLLLTLVHESSHLKLFSAYLDDEIVLNDPAATYSSPLRAEPRPMNGIYHAAYVLARMVCLLGDLRRTGCDSAVLGEAAAGLPAALQASIDGFDAAFAVISDHGQLTELGRSIINEAAAGVDRARR